MEIKKPQIQLDYLNQWGGLSPTTLNSQDYMTGENRLSAIVSPEINSPGSPTMIMELNEPNDVTAKTSDMRARGPNDAL
mgnify:CR=1 FL=1